MQVMKSTMKTNSLRLISALIMFIWKQIMKMKTIKVDNKMKEGAALPLFMHNTINLINILSNNELKT